MNQPSIYERAEALLDLLESDFGQSGRVVRIEAIIQELKGSDYFRPIGMAFVAALEDPKTNWNGKTAADFYNRVADEAALIR